MEETEPDLGSWHYIINYVKWGCTLKILKTAYSDIPKIYPKIFYSELYSKL